MLFLEIGNDSLFYFPKIVERSRFCYNTTVRFDSIDCDCLFHSVLAPPRLDRIKRPPIPPGGLFVCVKSLKKSQKPDRCVKKVRIPNCRGRRPRRPCGTILRDFDVFGESATFSGGSSRGPTPTYWFFDKLKRRTFWCAALAYSSAGSAASGAVSALDALMKAIISSPEMVSFSSRWAAISSRS